MLHSQRESVASYLDREPLYPGISSNMTPSSSHHTAMMLGSAASSASAAAAAGGNASNTSTTSSMSGASSVAGSSGPSPVNPLLGGAAAGGDAAAALGLGGYSPSHDQARRRALFLTHAAPDSFSRAAPVSSSHLAHWVMARLQWTAGGFFY